MSIPLRTVKQFVEHNPAFTTGGVRWSIFNEKTNGLAESGAIIRQHSQKGKRGRVLIHEDRYLKWAMGEAAEADSETAAA